MVAVKTHQADAFLKAVDRLPPAVLIYGPDAGLVTERAQGLAKRLAAHEEPPSEIIRLDDADLEAEPDRIAIELQTIPMFGGRKIVRAAAGRRITANALRSLVEGGKLEGVLIVEAGNLRADEALRTLFEKSAAAAAIACFPDAARDLEGVVQDMLTKAKLQITPEAKKLLLARLGADRALSRAEVEKLVLYARGRATIEESDVEAAVGDAAELALERVVMAAASRRTGDAMTECDRSIAAGENPQTIIAALQRHFLRLHAVRSALDAGRGMEEAMRQLRPPPHFKERPAFEQQCRDWTLAKLNMAVARISEAAKAARLSPALETTLAESLLIDLGALGEGKS